MANVTVLVGRMGKDPEARTSPSGAIRCTFSVATSGRKKDGEQWVEETTWHNVVAFGKTAEFLVQYGKKGREIYVRGAYKSRTYRLEGESKDRTIMEVVIDEANLLGPKPADTSGDTGSGDPSQVPQDDIPF